MQIRKNPKKEKVVDGWFAGTKRRNDHGRQSFDFERELRWLRSKTGSKLFYLVSSYIFERTYKLFDFLSRHFGKLAFPKFPNSCLMFMNKTKLSWQLRNLVFCLYLVVKPKKNDEKCDFREKDWSRLGCSRVVPISIHLFWFESHKKTAPLILTFF